MTESYNTNVVYHLICGFKIVSWRLGGPKKNAEKKQNIVSVYLSGAIENKLYIWNNYVNSLIIIRQFTKFDNVMYSCINFTKYSSPYNKM